MKDFKRTTLLIYEFLRIGLFSTCRKDNYTGIKLIESKSQKRWGKAGLQVFSECFCFKWILPKETNVLWRVAVIKFAHILLAVFPGNYSVSPSLQHQSHFLLIPTLCIALCGFICWLTESISLVDGWMHLQLQKLTCRVFNFLCLMLGSRKDIWAHLETYVSSWEKNSPHQGDCTDRN